ncbi:MAG: protease complex subunit PrcB family protein [Lachnospiraceae bacterium]|nr:protease complex subunit PrcB family protein [Lachnospiraceae bacterium]
MKKKAKGLVILAMVALLSLAGCSIKTQERDEKLKDMEFTVLGEGDIPQELRELVEERKEEEFKLTYQDGDFLYICIGYGRQETGGYSITVSGMYLTANAIYVDTNLIGPEPGEKKLYGVREEGASYPYVVLRTEYLEKPVVFD